MPRVVELQSASTDGVLFTLANLCNSRDSDINKALMFNWLLKNMLHWHLFSADANGSEIDHREIFTQQKRFLLRLTYVYN